MPDALRSRMLPPLDVTPPLSKPFRYSSAIDFRCSSVMVWLLIGTPASLSRSTVEATHLLVHDLCNRRGDLDNPVASVLIGAHTSGRRTASSWAAATRAWPWWPGANSGRQSPKPFGSAPQVGGSAGRRAGDSLLKASPPIIKVAQRNRRHSDRWFAGSKPGGAVDSLGTGRRRRSTNTPPALGSQAER